MFIRIKNIKDKRLRFVAEMDIYVVNIQCYGHKNYVWRVISTDQTMN